MKIDLNFWRKKSKRKPAPKPVLRNYKQPAYIYQKQYRTTQHTSFWDAIFQPYDLNIFLTISYLITLVFVATFPQPLFLDAYWHPPLDFNRDGFFTISDVLSWIRWLYFMPGNVIIAAFLQSPGLALFFEIHTGSYEGVGSFFMSMLYWWTTGGANLVFLWLVPIGFQTYFR
jgi:hypothetical protein